MRGERFAKNRMPTLVEWKVPYGPQGMGWQTGRIKKDH